MVMMKSLVFPAVVVTSSVADASTVVAVLEFGRRACVAFMAQRPRILTLRFLSQIFLEAVRSSRPLI
jgi:hypothetical protein